MNIDIEATAKLIRSARHSDAFTQDACEKILRDNLSGEPQSGNAHENQAVISAPALNLQPKPESWQEIAREVADGFLIQLRQWIGFDLQPRVRARLITEILAAIERSHAAQPNNEFVNGFKEGWMRACVFYVDIDAEFPDHDCSKQLEIRLKDLAAQPQPQWTSLCESDGHGRC